MSIVNLYSEKSGEIGRFLYDFYEKKITLENDLKWEKFFENPVDMADIIGIYVDNKDDFKVNMWISLDEGAFINVTESNADTIIRYLYERYPY
ncbi:MAG: hypothetical protein HFJ24_04505 [Clostridia bacterium]|nr:hypothetical protein [Clostridia bacterium]MCI9275244.1 hypothetical protein [Clostridia bacterium]